MDTEEKKLKYSNPLQEQLSDKQKNEPGKEKEDDREILGVDDKLIGDDLDIDEAHQNCRDKETGTAGEDNVY